MHNGNRKNRNRNRNCILYSPHLHIENKINYVNIYVFVKNSYYPKGLPDLYKILE